MRRIVAAATLLLVSACAFYSDAPLFHDREAAAPFGDGGRFQWRERGDDETDIVIYQREGAGYLLRAADEADSDTMRVVFIPVETTEEEDYVAQVQIEPDEAGRIYAFMWRTPSGFRIVASPSVVRERPIGPEIMSRHCVESPNGECRLVTRDDVMHIYRAIHRSYVAGTAMPDDYIDQTPLAAARTGKS